ADQSLVKSLFKPNLTRKNSNHHQCTAQKPNPLILQIGTLRNSLINLMRIEPDLFFLFSISFFLLILTCFIYLFFLFLFSCFSNCPFSSDLVLFAINIQRLFMINSRRYSCYSNASEKSSADHAALATIDKINTTILKTTIEATPLLTQDNYTLWKN
ncbi:uncharacterized protein VP01_3298g3, partial [Puccinia sorghi]